MDLALNTLQRLICHKTQTINLENNQVWFENKLSFDIGEYLFLDVVSIP